MSRANFFRFFFAPPLRGGANDIILNTFRDPPDVLFFFPYSSFFCLPDLLFLSPHLFILPSRLSPTLSTGSFLLLNDCLYRPCRLSPTLSTGSFLHLDDHLYLSCRLLLPSRRFLFSLSTASFIFPVAFSYPLDGFFSPPRRPPLSFLSPSPTLSTGSFLLLNDCLYLSSRLSPTLSTGSFRHLDDCLYLPSRLSPTLSTGSFRPFDAFFISSRQVAAGQTTRRCGGGRRRQGARLGSI